MNVAKVRAHSLRPDIVDDLISVGFYEVFRDTPEHPPERRIIIGPTSLERIVTLVIEPTEAEGVFRPVTAYFSSLKEIRRYRTRREQRS